MTIYISFFLLEFVVIHNGIITNYKDLRKFLVSLWQLNSKTRMLILPQSAIWSFMTSVELEFKFLDIIYKKAVWRSLPNKDAQELVMCNMFL